MIHRYLSPGEKIEEALFGRGEGIALGSEYCVHLLPHGREFSEALDFGKERNVPVTLLLPPLRDREIKNIMPILRVGSGYSGFRVVTGDWGTLFVVAKMFPGIEVIPGRCISGQKNCVRLDGSPFVPEEGRSLLRSDISGSKDFAKYLRDGFGVSRVAVSYTGHIPPSGGDMERVYHFPYILVTVTNYCPCRGNKPSFLVTACERLCRKGVVILKHESHRYPMFQRGKAKFYRPFDDGEELPGQGEFIVYSQVP